MRYILIGLLAVLFLAPSANAWQYGQGTCEDDIHCDSYRNMQENNRRNWNRVYENNYRNNSLWETRRANRARENQYDRYDPCDGWSGPYCD